MSKCRKPSAHMQKDNPAFSKKYSSHETVPWMISTRWWEEAGLPAGEEGSVRDQERDGTYNTTVTWIHISADNTANEGPVRIQYKCLDPIYVYTEMKLCNLLISKTEFMFCLPIPMRFISFQDGPVYSAAAKYVDRSWEYINRSQTHECRNWDWGRTIPIPGIHKFDFRYGEYTCTISRLWDH